MIDSADEVLAALQADTFFMSKVGTYTFTNGLTETALVVLGSNQTIPGIKAVSGVEVVINRVPDTTTRAVIAGCSVREKKWTIYLVQYEDSGPNDLVEAADRLMELAPGASYSVLGGTFQASDIAGIEQAVAKIPAHVPLTPQNG